MNDLLARLIAAGTPVDLVAEVALELARGEAAREALPDMIDHRSAAAKRQANYRQRGGGQVAPAVRTLIFERDGYRCVDCGSPDRLEIDHVIPLAKGGHPTDEQNLQTLCRPCNARKRDRIRKADNRGQSRTIAVSANVCGIPDPSPFPAPSPLLPPDPQQPPAPTHTPGSDIPRTREADPFPMPEDCQPQHWRDFLANRKRKNLPNTPTAHKRLMDDIARLTDEEWPPGRLIEHAAARGWAAIYDPRQGTRNERPNRHHDTDRGPTNPLVRAGLAFEAEHAARSQDDFH